MFRASACKRARRVVVVVVVGGGIIPKTQVATAQVGLFCFLLVPRQLPGIYLFLSLSPSLITVLALIAGLTYSSSAGNGEVQHYPSLQRLDTGARGSLCSNCRQGQKCAPRGRSRSALDHCSPRQPLHQQQQQAAASSRSSWRWRSDEDSLSVCLRAPTSTSSSTSPCHASPRHAIPTLLCSLRESRDSACEVERGNGLVWVV